MKSIEQMAKNPNFWSIDKHRVKPDPFPGKHPIRWRVTIAAKKRTYSFITKPNVLMARHIKWVALHEKGHLLIEEFDKSGVFLRVRCHIPLQEILVSTANNEITSRYFPWHAIYGDAYFFAPWEKAIFCKQIILGQHKFYVYAPWETMFNAAGFGRLRDYKRWLRTKLVLSK